MNKRTNREKTPQINKQTKQKENPDCYYTRTPSWRFTRMFLSHKWGLDSNGWSIWENEVLPKLKQFETQTWQEIMSATKSGKHSQGSKNHNIEVYKLCREAQGILEENHIHTDVVFSLRLNGTRRVFGILNNGVLDVLWYDENHEICPCQT